MLRIKDNVDWLKESKKYKFVEDDYGFQIEDENEIPLIRVYKPHRSLELFSNNELPNDIDYKTKAEEVLFDLIQAGLVEKVGEDGK